MAEVVFNFTGKRALVTGAGRGIGREIAKALAASGAETFGLSKTLKNLESLVAEEPRIHPICVDISDWEATRNAVEQIGKIDFLVNNAAVLPKTSFFEISENEIDQVFAINFKAVVNVSQVVAKKMIENNSIGSIVNISSLASGKVIPFAGLYSTTKGALDQLTRVMAFELGKHQIRVNSINPGFVNTDMPQHYLQNEEFIALKKNTRVPLGKISDTSDIVGQVLFLLSDRAFMITGAFVFIDGGMKVT